MNRLYGTARVNGTQETAESINTNNWTIRTCKTECTIMGVADVKLITWSNSGKYIYVQIHFA